MDPATMTTLRRPAMEWTFGTFLWSTLIFFFWFVIIWMFISLFADVLRRDDLSGWGKAGWIILMVVLPFIGILAYVIARPKVVRGDAMAFGASDRYPRSTSDYQAADEIAKAARLQDQGKITAAEFEQIKQHALSH
jgi:hypothetical protein